MLGPGDSYHEEWQCLHRDSVVQFSLINLLIISKCRLTPAPISRLSVYRWHVEDLFSQLNGMSKNQHPQYYWKGHAHFKNESYSIATLDFKILIRCMFFSLVLLCIWIYVNLLKGDGGKKTVTKWLEKGLISCYPTKWQTLILATCMIYKS